MCMACLGSGKLPAMQSAMTINGPSVRGKDTEVKCNVCNGKGTKEERE
jgi:hypothetical protein